MADHPPARRPGPLLLAGSLLGLQALGALVLGVFTLTQLPISRAQLGSGVAIWLVGFGLLLLFLARGVLLGRRWSRGPAVATQLILLPTAFAFRGAPTTWVAGAMAVAAAATLVGLLHPRSTEIFTAR